MILIAKEPVPGRVKTRLCPPCTPAEAARVAECALADTVDAIAAAGAARRVVAFEGDPGGWFPPGFEVVPQVGGGLGARLQAAFGHVAATGVGGPAMVLGMDTPQVSAEGIEEVLGLLAGGSTDSVLGRALDGGYWTIGFSEQVMGSLSAPGPGGPPELFLGVPMSEETTADAQLERLSQLGLSNRQVGSLLDIDLWEDALMVAREHPNLSTSIEVNALDRRSPAPGGAA